MRMERVTIAVVAMAAVGWTAGCRIDQHKNGNDEDVKIATPFGGLQVKTNGAAGAGDTGIDVYPGAVAEKKGSPGKDGDDGAADVNLSFGKFSLRVKAASYRTSDPADKVVAFYRGGLGKYGTVIACSNNRPVGKPDRTQDGLTCDSDNNSHISVSDDTAGKTELKAGSKQHQHIVSIHQEGTTTKIELVALDLPTGFSMGDSDDDSGKSKGERKQ